MFTAFKLVLLFLVICLMETIPNMTISFFFFFLSFPLHELLHNG